LETTPRDFAEQLDSGQAAAGADPDLWRIVGEPVGNYPKLAPSVGFSLWSGCKQPAFHNRGGRFCWSGGNAHMG